MKHISTRLIILLTGFLLIYVYDKWDYWFEAPQNPTGGNSGMTIPVDLVLNTIWIILWTVLLFTEQLLFWIKLNKNLDNVEKNQM